MSDTWNARIAVGRSRAVCGKHVSAGSLEVGNSGNDNNGPLRRAATIRYIFHGASLGLTEEVQMGVLALAVPLLVVLAACGAQDAPAAAPTTTSTPSESTSSIVGTWQRLTTCDQRVSALKSAGLGKFALEHAAGEGWIPGVTSPEQIKDPRHPCEGAVPLKHQHFFTDDGLFGSTDDEGNQVDDGTYRKIDKSTIVISKEFGNVRFHYRIRGGTLMLDPVMPKCATDG